MTTSSLVVALALAGTALVAAAPAADASSWCVWLQDRSCDGLACYYGTEPDTCVHPDDIPIPCRDWHCPDPDFP